MKSIGVSSLWVEKYRPQCNEDFIATADIKKLLEHIKTTGDVANLLLFSRSPGTGKTTLANVIAKELNCDTMYINGSIETSIDTIRYKVTQFSMTSSLMGGKKIVVLDECERISVQGQESLKSLMETVESNARFILCTNNMHKIVPPLISRCQVVSFEHSIEDRKVLMLQYFKRVIFILKNEEVEFDKEVVGELVKKLYPDLRKIINELQKFTKMHGSITKEIFGQLDDSQTASLIEEMKAKKFNNIRTICSNIDPGQFFAEFYSQANEHLQPQCIPDVILILGKYAFQHSSSIDSEINLVAAVIEICQIAIWK